MGTIIYFMRHSDPLKPKNIKTKDSLQIQNEKWCLSIAGENIAKKKSGLEELKNFDIVIASNYVRAIATAKYFTDKDIFVVEDFGERKFGIETWDELPKGFGKKQFEDFSYKVKNGESLNDVFKREYDALLKVLDEYKNKKILIVGHSTALATLFSKWCKVYYDKEYTFKEKVFFDGIWNYCETFKLEFDDNNDLINIENIKSN